MVDFPAKIQRKFQNMGKKCLKYRLKIYPRRIAKLNTANSNPREIIAPRKMNTLLHPAGYAVLLQRPWCACAGNRPWTLLYRSVIKVSNLFFVFSSNFQQSHISTVFGYGGIPENIRDFFCWLSIMKNTTSTFLKIIQNFKKEVLEETLGYIV